MKTKDIIILIIISVAIIAPAFAVPIGNEERDCYLSELFPGRPVFFCMYAGTQDMDHSFFEYQTMHEYYTPQLKEIVVGAGGSFGLTAKKTISTLTITGSPSYLYVKHT